MEQNKWENDSKWDYSFIYGMNWNKNVIYRILIWNSTKRELAQKLDRVQDAVRRSS